jgi:hypothetical protein
MAKRSEKNRRSFHVRLPWALRSAWPILVRAYVWYLERHNSPDRPQVFIPIEIDECESDRQTAESEGKCCYNIFVGPRLYIGVWVHSEGFKNERLQWVVDRVVIDEWQDRVKDWTGPEALAELEPVPA